MKWIPRTSFFIPVLALSLLILNGCGSHLSKRKKKDMVIAKARSYIGTPYKFGGTSSSGMDCSGLLLNSFKAIDYKMPRTSAEQRKLGSRVGKNEIVRGDLLFFATGKKKRKITHVALVTNVRKGEIFFIHASTSKGVTESSLDNAYWKKRFRQARRVI
jgi:cell wall-associated NlpC family hydrolase